MSSPLFGAWSRSAPIAVQGGASKGLGGEDMRSCLGETDRQPRTSNHGKHGITWKRRRVGFSAEFPCPSVLSVVESSSCPRRTMSGLLTLVVVLSGACLATAQEPDRPKAPGGFGEARRGDVPDGTLEMMTPAVDRAIASGLAWLARTQND